MSTPPNVPTTSDPTEDRALVSGSGAIIRAGMVLAGKYEVERVLGAGGMGVVVAARHLALDERVALKFLQPAYAHHPEASSRFLREARAAAKIKSQHVARVSDIGELEQGAPYMVMEYLEGSDLSALLAQQGPFAPSDAVELVLQACEAIAEAHAYGIVHRDLKPANLFLVRQADGSPLLKVLDFGISKVMGGTDSLTRTGTAVGSGYYMSPEQMTQTHSVDHRTDIYALGVVLYQLVSARLPFEAKSLHELCAAVLLGVPTPLTALCPELPPAFCEVVARACERTLEGRYQTVAELAAALAPFASPRALPLVAKIGAIAAPLLASGERAVGWLGGDANHDVGPSTSATGQAWRLPSAPASSATDGPMQPTSRSGHGPAPRPDELSAGAATAPPWSGTADAAPAVPQRSARFGLVITAAIVAAAAAWAVVAIVRPGAETSPAAANANFGRQLVPTLLASTPPVSAPGPTVTPLPPGPAAISSASSSARVPAPILRPPATRPAIPGASQVRAAEPPPQQAAPRPSDNPFGGRN